MNVTTAEILELFDEAQTFGRRWRDPGLSIEGGLVLTDRRAANAPAPIRHPRQRPRRGLFVVAMPPYYRNRSDRRAQVRVEITIEPCQRSHEPCAACGGTWEYREGLARPIHIPHMKAGQCKPPDRTEFSP